MNKISQVYTDVALDPYSTMGHDGIVRSDGAFLCHFCFSPSFLISWLLRETVRRCAGTFSCRCANTLPPYARPESSISRTAESPL